MTTPFVGILFTDFEFRNRILTEIMNEPMPEKTHFKTVFSNPLSMSSDNFKMFKEFLHLYTPLAPELK